MSYVTRDELRGLSPRGLIVLYVNRVNDLGVTEGQIKLTKLTRLEDGTVEAIVEPDQSTGWNNGPIILKVPSVNVEEVYGQSVDIDFLSIGSKVRDEVLNDADLPPAPPATVEVAEFDILNEGPHLSISYRLTYSNAFFTGSVVAVITNAPNNLDTLRILNNLFIGN